MPVVEAVPNDPVLLDCPFCKKPGRYVSYYHPRCPFPDPWYIQCTYSSESPCVISPETSVFGTKADAALEWNSGVTWLMTVLEHDVETERLAAIPTVIASVRALKDRW